MDNGEDAILRLTKSQTVSGEVSKDERSKGQVSKDEVSKDEVRYSYASVADTFFWGEKRQYLPSFQVPKRKNEVQDAALFQGLKIVGGTAAARKE